MSKKKYVLIIRRNHIDNDDFTHHIEKRFWYKNKSNATDRMEQIISRLEKKYLKEISLDDKRFDKDNIDRNEYYSERNKDGSHTIHFVDIIGDCSEYNTYIHINEEII